MHVEVQLGNPSKLSFHQRHPDGIHCIHPIRATKQAEKRKAVEEVVEEAEVVVVEGPSEEARPQKRAKMAEATRGLTGSLKWRQLRLLVEGKLDLNGYVMAN